MARCGRGEATSCRDIPPAGTPAAQKSAPSADKPKASACDRHAFRAIIDVGHTLGVGGATSARGIYEYEFNLRLAEASRE